MGSIGSRLRSSRVFSGLSPVHLHPVDEEGRVTGGGPSDEVDGGTDTKEEEEEADLGPTEVEIELHQQEQQQDGGEGEGERWSESPVGPIPVSTGPDPAETEL